jgi:DNA replication protein DnaC
VGRRAENLIAIGQLGHGQSHLLRLLGQELILRHE